MRSQMTDDKAEQHQRAGEPEPAAPMKNRPISGFPKHPPSFA
jgi:hypothetical protein